MNREMKTKKGAGRSSKEREAPFCAKDHQKCKPFLWEKAQKTSTIASIILMEFLRRSTAALLLFSFGVAPLVSAEPFIPKMNAPKNFAEIEYGVEEARQNRETVECGGWAKDTSGTGANGSVEGEIFLPDISPDVPGERNRANEERNDDALKSGLGVAGNFEYPASAFGFVSACDIHQAFTNDEDLAQNGMKIVYDFINDPDEDPNVRTEAGGGEIMINPYGWCLGDKRTPRWCQKLFETLREMDSLPEIHFNVNSDCADPAAKNYCFSPEFTKTCQGEECRTTPTSTSECTDITLPSFVNKLSECHRDILPDETLSEVVLDRKGKQEATLASFYRHYAGTFSDWTETKDDTSSLTVQSPKDEWKLRVECYDYYREHSPKECVMGEEDEQCEIILKTDSEDAPNAPQWKDDDEHKQKGEVKPKEEDVREEPSPRASRGISSPWVEDDKSNLSLLDSEKLSTLQQNLSDPFDLTRISRSLLPVRMKAAIAKKVHSARADAFSENGERGREGDERKSIAQFWEDEQRALLTRLREPQIRLILPSRFLLGLSEHDPLFTLADHTETRSSTTTELTIGAGRSVLESVIMSLQRSTVLPLEEVRLPIVVPAISATEIDHLIADWNQWKIAEDAQAKESKRPSTAGNVNDIVARLESYKDYLHSVRELRSVLVRILEQSFEPERQIREFLSQWYKQNLEIFATLEQENTQRTEMKTLWRDIQHILLETDASQLQWCSNQRFTLPLFGMLDRPERWWGEKEPHEKRDEEYKPERSLQESNYTQPSDREYDFSTMKFSTGSIRIPTLWPVRVAISLPHPPVIGATPIDASQLFTLPTLPTPEEIFSLVRIPTVSLPPPPTISPLPVHDFTEDIKILEEWKSRMEKRKVAYERFQKSLLTPPDPEQKKVVDGKIIHPEYELRPRIERLFARWLALHKVDYASREARFVSGETSAAEDQCPDGIVCEVLPAIIRSAKVWQWFAPESTLEISTLSNTLRTRSLPPEDANPFKASLDLLQTCSFHPPSLDLQNLPFESNIS